MRNNQIAARSGRASPQLIIGVIIALIAIGGYFFKTQRNPVTGEVQRVGDLTPKDEVYLGMQAAPKMAAQMGGAVTDSDPQARLVDEVGKRLVDYTDAAKSPYKFEFHLLANRDMINAFALPGGQIFITRALLDKMETEAQLAGVLGHEIAHVIHRHSAEHIAKGQLGQGLVAAVAVGASDRRQGMSAAMLASFVSNMIQLKYGRNDERESDEYGVKYMAQAGYDPRGMIHVMRVLKQAGGGRGGPDFMSTHPDPGDREQTIKQIIEKNYPNGVPSNLTEGRRLK
jgi:predicted Zn-dependent protease